MHVQSCIDNYVLCIPYLNIYSKTVVVCVCTQDVSNSSSPVFMNFINANSIPIPIKIYLNYCLACVWLPCGGGL